MHDHLIRPRVRRIRSERVRSVKLHGGNVADFSSTPGTASIRKFSSLELMGAFMFHICPRK
jgi:hypothetical protein